MDLEKNIEDWILEKLSSPSPVFNNFPICPFAKQAWLNNKVYIKYHQDLNLKEDTILLNNYEVIIYAYDPSTISPEELSDKSLSMCNQEVVALEDHPHEIEEIQNVLLNNGTYALILVQQRDKLEQARTILKSKNYYKNWDKKYLDEVLSQ